MTNRTWNIYNNTISANNLKVEDKVEYKKNIGVIYRIEKDATKEIVFLAFPDENNLIKTLWLKKTPYNLYEISFLDFESFPGSLKKGEKDYDSARNLLDKILEEN